MFPYGWVMYELYSNRSNHWRCSVGRGVVRNFAKFTGKHLCQILFFNKLAGLVLESLFNKAPGLTASHFIKRLQQKACNFIKKETLAQVFSWEFCEISNNTFFTENLWGRLLLYIIYDYIFEASISSRLLLKHSIERKNLIWNH